jgi:20S proteasome subunit beta 6
VVIAVNGFAADGNHFVKRLKQRLEVRASSRLRGLSLFHLLTYLDPHLSQWYEHAHHKEMPVQAVARLVQTMLYARRM